jgi:hypothetical protein
MGNLSGAFHGLHSELLRGLTMGLRWSEPREQFTYERRGANYYGFCEVDEKLACKVIVRPRLSDLRKAMHVHQSMHHGQLAFPEPEPLPDLPPW